MKTDALNIVWEKCIHGIEKRNPMGCQQCRLQETTFSHIINTINKNTRIPIKRECTVSGPCFCNGRCNEVIGYRDPLFPGEK